MNCMGSSGCPRWGLGARRKKRKLSTFNFQLSTHKSGASAGAGTLPSRFDVYLSAGAWLCALLLAAAAFTFVLARLVQKKQVAMMSGRAVPYEPAPRRAFDTVMFLACALVALSIVGVLAVAVVWYLLAKMIQRSRGINVDYAFKEIPPE